MQLDPVLDWLFGSDPIRGPGVEQRARELFLDTLGCMVAGLDKPEVIALTKRLAELEGGGVRLPCAPATLSPPSAAQMAAVAACWDEACEGLARAHGRPGLHSFATVLALSLAGDRTLGDALRALVVGYEVGGRLGEVLRARPGMHVDGTWGLFGAVAAAVRLQFESDVEARDAALATLNAAACQVPFSLYLAVAAGATVRNTYAGHAAAQAIRLLAGLEAGITAPDDAVAEFGARALGLGRTDLILAPPGEWLITQGYLKPFAAARHVHYGAQAALDWRGRSGQKPQSITTLRLSTYDEATTYCGNRAPKAALQGQFSLTYGVARVLVHGDLDPSSYTPEALADPEVMRLEGLIELEVDKSIGAGQRGSRLAVTTPDGSKTYSVDQVPGDPDLPLSKDQVRAKFGRYAAPSLGDSRATRIADAVLEGRLETRLSEILSAPPPLHSPLGMVQGTRPGSSEGP